MTNAKQWIDAIQTGQPVRNPMGAGKIAPIAPEDVAAIAVEALLQPDLSGEVLELTGPELMTVPDQVGILARTLDLSLQCIDVPLPIAIEGLIRKGIPEHIAAAMGESFTAVQEGRAAMLTKTVEHITGRKPRNFETWVREHASQF
jgi:uncharacterized protein YbjT (DUF2867 family)